MKNVSRRQHDKNRCSRIATVDSCFALIGARQHCVAKICNASPAANPGGGGVLPYKRLLGMCCWMGSHFHDWIDYNGVAFLVELLEWGRTFSGFLG